MGTKEYHVAKAKEARQRKCDYINELKANPCTDCGQKFHFSAMDFDHIDASTKVKDIGHLVGTCSWANLKAEIEKCELVCSNCHRVRSWKRLHGLVF